MKTFATILLLALSAMMMLAACHKDDQEPAPQNEGWTVEAFFNDDSGDEITLPWRAAYQSVTVSICGRGAGSRVVLVSTDADWLTINADTLASDSIVAIATISNETGVRRKAALFFVDADNSANAAQISVTQLSRSDIGTNADAAREQLYVGYGYDIYKALESPMAVRTLSPVLDYQYMVQHLDIAAKYQLVQDCRLSRTDMRYVSSSDVHAYGRDLSEQQTDDADHSFEGCLYNCLAAEGLVDPSKGSLEQQNLGHGALEKAVAARVIDRAALIDLQRKGSVPYDNQFSSRLYACRAAKGDTRAKLIEQLLVDYGTHVVIQADLGGRIDYTFTMQKSASFNSKTEMEEEINYTLGRIADADRKAANRLPSSSKAKTGAITITGGSPETRAVLETQVKSLDTDGQIDPGHLTDWLSTINYSEHPEGDDNLEVIHFELMPLWNLVHDDIRQDVMDATFKMVSRSDCALPSQMTGTDIYEINLNGRDKSLFNFSNVGDDQSLCRILYYDDVPVLQVCSEYVPKIRTDERVLVAYPIYKQHIRLNQGLFVGDGVHQPAYVGFSGGDCYVNPLPEYKRGDKVEVFYYVNGNLLLQNPTSVSLVSSKRRNVQDDCLMLYTNDSYGAVTHRHPIVKVGSNFWTRCDIDHLMMFAEKDDGTTSDQLYDGVLYTRFQWDVNNVFAKYNGWTWGYEPNTFYDNKPNTKWYLPMTDDLMQLYNFLGFNPKSLFAGQVSGWNARFNGYYGISDIHNQNRNFSGGQRQVRYKGELNVVSSRNSQDLKEACILVINPDYTLELIDDKTYRNSFRYEWRNNYYPVRPVRGYMYEYPTLSTIKKNMR